MNELRIDRYVLIQARSQEEAAGLVALVTRIPGVATAQRVHGPYDVIAEVRAENGSAMGPETAIRELEGVLRAIPLAIGSPSDRSADGEAARGEAA